MNRNSTRLFRPAAVLGLLVLFAAAGCVGDELIASLRVCDLVERSTGLAEVEILEWHDAGFIQYDHVEAPVRVTEVRVRASRNVYGPLEAGEWSVHVEGPVSADGTGPDGRLILGRDGVPTRGFMFYIADPHGPVSGDQHYFRTDDEGNLRNGVAYAAAPLSPEDFLAEVEYARTEGTCPPSAEVLECRAACDPCLAEDACEGHCGVHAACIVAAADCDAVGVCVQGPPPPTCEEACERCVDDGACAQHCAEQGACILAADLLCPEITACVSAAGE